MKTKTKVSLSILGACNKVMSMFIPIAVALMWIDLSEINGYSAMILMTVAIASTLFRAVQVWLE